VVSLGSTVATRLGRVGSVALATAAVYGLLIVLAGFLAPVYRSTSASSSGEVTHGTDTLVGMNGSGVLVVLAVPLLVTVTVGAVLWQRSWRLSLPTAWTLTGLMAVLNVLAMMSVGLFFLPVTVALVVACSTCRPRRPAADVHAAVAE
jgi:hypothetical protein